MHTHTVKRLSDASSEFNRIGQEGKFASEQDKEAGRSLNRSTCYCKIDGMNSNFLDAQWLDGVRCCLDCRGEFPHSWKHFHVHVFLKYMTVVTCFL